MHPRGIRRSADILRAPRSPIFRRFLCAVVPTSLVLPSSSPSFPSSSPRWLSCPLPLRWPWPRRRPRPTPPDRPLSPPVSHPRSPRTRPRLCPRSRSMVSPGTSSSSAMWSTSSASSTMPARPERPRGSRRSRGPTSWPTTSIPESSSRTSPPVSTAREEAWRSLRTARPFTSPESSTRSTARRIAAWPPSTSPRGTAPSSPPSGPSSIRSSRTSRSPATLCTSGASSPR